MPSYYIYAPFNGGVSSLNCYCNAIGSPCSSPCASEGSKCKDIATCTTCSSPCGCSGCCYHTIVGTGHCCPLDLSGVSANTYIYAWMGWEIASVKVVYMSGVCASATGDINNGIFLEVYTGFGATGVKLGRLLYGHIKNRQLSNGRIVSRPPDIPDGQNWYLILGQVPEYPGPNTCYSGPHTHFSIRSESGVSKTRNGNLNCATPVYAGSTRIYWWTY
jgi:hypothetical protein